MAFKSESNDLKEVASVEFKQNLLPLSRSFILNCISHIQNGRSICVIYIEFIFKYWNLFEEFEEREIYFGNKKNLWHNNLDLKIKDFEIKFENKGTNFTDLALYENVTIYF